MKSVLLITNIFPPMIGGPATFIDKAAGHFARQGIRVTVICSSKEKTHAGDAARPFRVVRIPIGNRIIYELRLRWALFWGFLRHRHILVNGLESQVGEVARLLGRRYVLKIVGDGVWEMARNQGTTLLDIDAFQTSPEAQQAFRGSVAKRNRPVHLARTIVTPSDYLKGVVTGWGVAPEKVVRIFNGVELGAAAGTAPVVREPGEPLRLLFVGRLTNWKGVETLLLALTTLDGVHAVVAGDGPEYPHLVELARQLDLGDKVRFTGRVAHAEVRRLMEQSHVLVLTSLYEGLSHTLLEAGALGLPVIASDRGGNSEVVVSGQNGLLVPAQDVGALRRAIAQMTDDEPARRAMASRAREMIVAYDLNETIGRFGEEVFR